MRTVVLDTNVLLADPGSVLGFDDGEVIIPETVLGELDKLKTSRVDPDLRFRGREVSRLLFDLSEQGSLVDGVDLPDGGRLRVVPFESDADLPDGLSARNADDRILAVAFQVSHDKSSSVTMITNDLNMLLKAQSLGIAVERYGDGVEGGFAKRYIIRPFQRYRVPLGILAVSLAVFAAVLLVAVYGSRITTSGSGSVPEEFQQLLTPELRGLLEDFQALERDPNDAQALLDVANYYYELREQTGDPRYSRQAIAYYNRYLKIQPEDLNARTDLAIELYLSGQTDQAIQEVNRALEREPNHINANFNLGIFYWKGRREFQAADAQFTKVIELTAGSTSQAEHSVQQQALSARTQMRTEADAAGAPLSIPETEGVTF